MGYHLYTNQQEFASEEEKKQIKNYVEAIAREFRTNPNIHYYYTNQWNLQQAIDAASEGKFLGKQKNGEYTPGVIDYLRKLKQGDLPLNPHESLTSLRQADEYHWVKYLRDAFDRVSTDGDQSRPA